MGNLSLSVFCYEIKAVDVFGDVKYSRFESVSLARNFNSIGLAGFDILELKIAERACPDRTRRAAGRRYAHDRVANAPADRTDDSARN